MAIVPFHEARLLRANPRHITSVIKKALPDGYVIDHIKLGTVKFGKYVRDGAQRDVSIVVPCTVAVRHKRLTTGHEKIGRYSVIIDIHELAEIRVSEFFEWKDWMHTRSMSSGSSKPKRRR